MQAQRLVHLFVLSLESLASQRDEMAAILSTQEQAWAARYRFPKDRTRFVLGRAALRHTLSAYVGSSPDSLRFKYGDFGKPLLNGLDGAHEICFNASGSQGLVAIAVGRDDELGVDIERIRPFDDWRLIVRQHFTATEQKALFQLPELRQVEAFFYSWTVKEAVLKRTGQGLRQGLDQIEVAVESFENPQVKWRQPTPEWARPGMVWTFRVQNTALVALATGPMVTDVQQGKFPVVLRPAAMTWTSMATAPLDEAH